MMTFTTEDGNIISIETILKQYEAMINFLQEKNLIDELYEYPEFKEIMEGKK